MKSVHYIPIVLLGLFCCVCRADVPDESSLKEAFFGVYNIECVPSSEEEAAFLVQLEVYRKILKEAGEDRIFEMMAEMLNSDDIKNSMFPDEGISTLCRIARKLSYSEVFHSAVRECQKRINLADDGWYGYGGLFDYLVKYGDETDLEWMKKIRELENEQDDKEDLSIEWIDQFEARLAK